MSDNIIPFRRREEPQDQRPASPAHAPETEEVWTLVKIVPQAPPPSR